MNDADGKYLIFTAGAQHYAMSFSDVKRISPVDPEVPPKRVPDMPDYVLGTVLSDGELITVIGLRRRFGAAEKILNNRNCILVCDGEKHIGLLCDSVTEFRQVEDKDIHPAPDVNEQVNARFITGEFIADGETCWIIRPELIIRPDDEQAFERGDP